MDILQIDMTEEPEDDEDRIFLATNKWTGDGYKLVIPHEHVDAASVAAAAAAISQSIVNIGQQLSSIFSNAFAPAMQAARAADEERARQYQLYGLEKFNIQAYDLQARESRLHKEM